MDWLWEIEQELAEINSASVSPESKDKIKILLNQIGILLLWKKKRMEKKMKTSRGGNYLQFCNSILTR
jgi:hypothetical protein